MDSPHLFATGSRSAILDLARRCVERGYHVLPVTDRRDSDWRAACWVAPSASAVDRSLARNPGAAIWIACGRSVFAIRAAKEIADLVEEKLGPAGLSRSEPDGRRIFVYAAAEPIVSQRLPGADVLGLASRFEAYAGDHAKPGGWSPTGPHEMPVANLPRISNEQIIAFAKGLCQQRLRQSFEGIGLDLDRAFLVEELSSRHRLAAQLAMTATMGKKAARVSLIEPMRSRIPQECRGLVMEPISAGQATSAKTSWADGRWRSLRRRTDPDFFADLAPPIAANGYSVLPVLPHAKNMLLREHWRNACWQRPSNEAIAQFARSRPKAGVGLPCGRYVAALDIDASDPAWVDAAVATAHDVLGATPLVRYGRSPRLVMLYRCSEPIITARWRDIEMLGLGTQVVAYGIHPRTGQPYRWGPDGEPVRTPLAELPAVSNADVERFMQACIKRFGHSARPIFDLDSRNFTPILSSVKNISRLLLGSLVRDAEARRFAAQSLIERRYYGTGSGLAVEWREPTGDA
jgi:hypothetical protein